MTDRGKEGLESPQLCVPDVPECPAPALERAFAVIDDAIEQLSCRNCPGHGGDPAPLPAWSAASLGNLFKRIVASYLLPGAPATIQTESARGLDDLATYVNRFNRMGSKISRQTISEWRAVCQKPVEVEPFSFQFMIEGNGTWFFYVRIKENGRRIAWPQKHDPPPRTFEWLWEHVPDASVPSAVDSLFSAVTRLSVGDFKRFMALVMAWAVRTGRALYAFFLPKSLAVSGIAIAAVAVGTIGIWLTARHTGNEDVASHTITIRGGQFVERGEESSRMLITTNFEHGGKVVQSLRLIENTLTAKTSFPEGKRDRYIERGYWAGPDGRSYKFDLGVSGKWLRAGVIVGSRDGTFSVTACGNTFPLQETVRGTGDLLQYVFRFAEIPETLACLPGAKKVYSLNEEGYGELFQTPVQK